METNEIREAMKNSDVKPDNQVNGLTVGAKKLMESSIKSKKQLKRSNNNQTDDCDDLLELVNINKTVDNDLNVTKNSISIPQNNASNELTALLEKQAKASPKKIIKNKIANERNNKSFEDVENKLEEMFAGIDDVFVPNPSENDVITIEDDIQPTDLSMNKNRKQIEENKLSPKSVHSITNATIATSTPIPPSDATIIENSAVNTSKDTATKSKDTTASSTNNKVPPKKRRKITKKSNQKAKGKQALINAKTIENKISLSKSKPNTDAQQINEYKGPYIQIKPDGSELVVNGPLTEEDSEKQGKKPLLSHLKIKNKTRIRGLHNSTLSTKYDAHTTDASWLCVFCKKGPHKEALGDLFGPYIITTECEEFELCKNPKLDAEFNKKRIKSEMTKSNANSYYVVQSTSHSTDTKEVKKKKKSIDKKPLQVESSGSIEFSEILDSFEGMIKISDNSYEVWVHEDCAVWANGIYLIGAKLVGLELGVWNSFNQICTTCAKNGAIMQCLHRGCTQKAHYICAKLSNWSLNEETFKMYCETHSISIG